LAIIEEVIATLARPVLQQWLRPSKLLFAEILIVVPFSTNLPVTVIIPARNEEATLPLSVPAVLASGPEAVVLVDDGSTDGTSVLLAGWACSDSRVQVVSAGSLPEGWTGKNHAVWVGAKRAQSTWLLFLDADARLLPGALQAAVAEAEEGVLDALSLSPEQEALSIWERAVLPVIYDELSRRYPYARVNDAADACAAANGQFFLIRRAAYEAVGGHAALRGEVLEDLRLAERLKRAGFRLRFRSGQGQVRTRMYRDRASLWEGWIKNLYLLWGPPRLGPLLRLILPVAIGLLSLGLWAAGFLSAATFGVCLVGLCYARQARRLRRLGWKPAPGILLGAAATVILRLRSTWRHRRHGEVRWRGRTVLASGSVTPGASPEVRPVEPAILVTKF